MIDLAGFDLGARAASWQAARPFPHLVLDDVVDADALLALRAAVASEPQWPSRSEIHEMMASADTVQHPTLRAFHQRLGAADTLAAIAALSGHSVSAAQTRSYTYLANHYLLPHTDSQARLGRRVAYAFYVFCEGLRGGELELIDCDLDEEDAFAARTRPAHSIEVRANRMVLFEVSARSLHRVCEVAAGARVSLAGWFIA